MGSARMDTLLAHAPTPLGLASQPSANAFAFMSCSPTELQKKSEEFCSRWQGYVEAPCFEQFIEFAVSASSFTAFLDSKRFSGLHKLCRELEQHALTLFGNENSHPIAEDVLAKLNAQVEGLRARVDSFIDNNTRPIDERRAHHAPEVICDLTPTHRICLIGDQASTWQDLTTQLGYFGILAEAHTWDQLTTATTEPAIVMLDVASMDMDLVCKNLKQLRTRFSATKLISVNLEADFNTFNRTLGAGCDFCFVNATPEVVIMDKLIELCSNEDEPPYRVLVVEDSITASKSIQRTLEASGVESFVINKPQEVLDGLMRVRPDLILMDMFMPGCTGVEAARVIRQHAEFLSTPIIYLSGDTNVPLQVDALRLGGDHFLTKPYNPVVLNAIVKSKIERYRALRRSMVRDSLTGLFNHITAKEKLTQALHAAQAENSALSVAMIDIDHFKQVNDDYGHQSGDHVIRYLAWFLKQRLRKTDLVGRYGGEEFLVVLPGADAEQAITVLERIRQDFSQIRHPFNETWFNTTFSGGVSEFPSHTTGESLIKRADEALYQAKRGGRNCLVQA
jgi:diguanylate cyclase (GGDEF)-like protein